MNSTVVKLDDLESVINELTDYSRPISYNLSEILIVPVEKKLGRVVAYQVFYRKDKR